MLFDAGPGTMRRLMEAGTAIHDISIIFLSHFHPDHTGELASFLFSTKYASEDGRKEPLTLVGAKGFADFHAGLRNVYGNWIALPEHLLRIVEMDNRAVDSREFDGFRLQTAPVVHNEESIAFRITGSGVSVVYSGDTDVCESLADLAVGASLFICESSFPDELKRDGHLTPSLAGQLATRAKAERLLLTHFYPECESVDIEKQCRRAYSGRLYLARDLMKIVL